MQKAAKMKKKIKSSRIYNFMKKGKNKLKSYKSRISPSKADSLRLEYAECYEGCDIEDSMILYEAFAGRGMVCSPFGIFKMFSMRPDFNDYTHVWVLEDEGAVKSLREKWDFPNVEFTVRDTPSYCRYLCRAKFLVNNLSFPPYFTKKREQVYINTWHGIPLKTLGFDIPEGRITGLNTIRNFLSVDVFLSPNSFMTERFKESFLLEGISEGGVMESGMPRNDSLFHTRREDIIKSLREAGVSIDENKKLILYAPTWKGEKYSDPDTSTGIYYELMDKVEKKINKKEYQILVKPHQIVYKHIMEKGEGLTDRFIPASIDANELLSITDVLISDYSSIYFDYLATDGTIIFYIPDLEDYQKSRGLYFGIDKLPGPVAQNLEELGMLVKNFSSVKKKYKIKYGKERMWACPNDDGSVCDRVIEKIIVKEDMEGLISFNPREKAKLLVYSGDLQSGSRRSRLKKWVKSMDFEIWDITMIVPHTDTEPVLNWIKNLDSRVRVLRRTGKMAVTKNEYKAADYIEKNKIRDAKNNREFMEQLIKICRREVLRTVGISQFDYAMDFSGKSMYFQNLFSCMEGTKCISLNEI